MKPTSFMIDQRRGQAKARGWSGATIAGTDSLVGVPMVGELGDGQVWVYDAATGTLIPGDLATLLGDEFLTRATGGRAATSLVPASGASQTLDLEAANVFDVTLTANCTFSFSNPPPAGEEGEWAVILRQGGSGSYVVTWPTNVYWRAADGTTTTTASTLSTVVGASDAVVITTLDGGITYGAALDSGAAVLAWIPMTVYDGSNWLPLVDGSGNQIMARV